MLCLDLSACAELANHRDRKETQKTTDNVIESDTNLGLKRDLANQTNALIKRGGRGMASDNEKLLCHVASLACVESCTFSSQTQKRHTCVSLWLRDGQKEREKESGNSCRWLGGGGGRTELLQRHTDRSLWKERITCARLLSCHILIPRLGPFGN